MGMLKSEQRVEDIVQDVYIKAFHAEKEKAIEHPKAYLFAVAKNLALNELTKKCRQLTSYIEECSPVEQEEEGASLESEVEADRSFELYCKAVAELPEKCRQVYLLRKVHGLKHKEIAKHLGISLSSVEKHLKLGAESCRDYLIRHGAEFETNASSPMGTGRKEKS